MANKTNTKTQHNEMEMTVKILWMNSPVNLLKKNYFSSSKLSTSQINSFINCELYVITFWIKITLFLTITQI